MAKLTWLGEDDLHGEGAAGPSFTKAFGDIKFPKDEPVEVRSHAIVQKALNNPFFEVDDADDVDDAPGKPVRRGRPSNADKAAEAAKMQAIPEPAKLTQSE
jgi:hypothetical protein